MTSPPPGAPGRPIFAAQRASQEPYLTEGDLVSFRLVQREQGKWNAQEVRVIEYSRTMPPHKRKTQEQVTTGAIAPGAGGGGAGGGAAAGGYHRNAASAVSSGIPPEIPFADLSTLVGTRLQGMVISLSPSAGQLPYGHLALHHLSTRKIIFLASEFRELKAHAAGMSSAQKDAAAANRISTLIVGDVLEFTLAADPVLKYTAHDISVTPTLTYAQEVVSARSQREIASRKEAPRKQMRELLDSLPPLLIRGGEMTEDESRMLEFKSLTRSANVHNASRNLLALAEKYMNSFLNSAGGVLMFGIEDDGTIVGLTFNKKDRDAMRTSIDALMAASTPPVDPQLYSIRFLPVRRLYKSSWASVGDEWLLGIQSAGHTPAALSRMMVSPDADDRVEHVLDLCVVAIAVCQGEAHVPFYTTSGRGIEGKECYVRQEGSSIKMTPAMIAERTKSRVVAAAAPDAAAARNEALIASLLRDIEEQRAQAVAAAASAPQPQDIAKLVRELMNIERAKDAQEAAAAAAAVAASSAAAAAPPAVAPSSSSRRGSASAASSSSPPVAAAAVPAISSQQFGETSDMPASTSSAVAASSSSSSSVASIPKALLRVLQEMHFPRGDILDAVFELTETGKVDFNVFNDGVAESREAHQAISAVLDLLEQKKAAVTPHDAPATAAASMAPSSSSSSSSSASSMPTVASFVAPAASSVQHGVEWRDHLGESSRPASASAASSASAFPAFRGEAVEESRQRGGVNGAAHLSAAGSSAVPAPAPAAAAAMSASAPSPSPSAAASAAYAEFAAAVPSAASASGLDDAAEDDRLLSDDSGPCEVCESLVPWVEYEAHQELCRANRIRRDKEEAELRSQGAAALRKM